MCFKSSTPDIPEPKDPILPKQPLQPQEPVGLSVGRGEEDDKFKQARAKSSRRKLRITRKDNAGVQIAAGSNPISNPKA